jgi:RNA polymerase sigma-70 factor, ECF subfamily
MAQEPAGPEGKVHEPSGAEATTRTTMTELRLVHAGHPEATANALPASRPVLDNYALVAGIRRGDPAAATAFFEQYRGLVERTLVRILGFDSELADAVQETFVRALGSSRLLRDPQALSSWMMRIAVFTATDLIRRRHRRRWLHLFAEVEDVGERASDMLLAGEPDVEVRRALTDAYAVLESLPVKERVAFSLRRMEGLELKEVARACGCSLATIKRRLVRAETHFLARAQKYPALASWLAAKEGAEP